MRGNNRLVLVMASVAAVLLASTIGATPASAGGQSDGGAPVIRTLHGMSGTFVPASYEAAHPGTVHRYQQLAAAAVATMSPRIPYSHYGCNHAVCIDVVGSGTHVTGWSTDVVGNYGCIKAFFDERHGNYPAYNTVWGPQLCSNGQSGTYIAYYGDLPNDWPNGDQLCNGWIKGVIGYACATIIA